MDLSRLIKFVTTHAESLSDLGAKAILFCHSFRDLLAALLKEVIVLINPDFAATADVELGSMILIGWIILNNIYRIMEWIGKFTLFYLFIIFFQEYL